MSAITVTVPDELAEQLRQHESQLPEILAMGLREFKAGSQPGFAGAAGVLDFLAGLPTPEAILTLHPSAELDRRVRELTERSKQGQLSPDEEAEWARYEFLEHLVRIAKTKACLKLGISPGADN